MVGQDINAFIEDLYDNPEKEITIDGAGDFLIYGHVNEDGSYTVGMYSLDDNGNICEFTNMDRARSVGSFCECKIYDNKTIYELQNSITVNYG